MPTAELQGRYDLGEQLGTGEFDRVYVPQLPSRIPSLDGLRAISILAVFLGHGSLSHNAPAFLSPFHHFGNLGVRFFFVISGFLITTLLMKEIEATGSISLKQFYVRRALRIFPASFAFIAVIAAMSMAGWIVLKSGDLFHSLTYTLNYHLLRSWWVDHLWSLSVEEQFYLIWPGLLFLAGAKRSFRIAIIVVAIAPVSRFALWFFLGASDSALTKHFESVADVLAMGCLLSVFYNRLGQTRWYVRLQRSSAFLLLAIVTVGIGNASYLLSAPLFYVFGQTVANVGTVLCIDWCIRNSESLPGRFLDFAPIRFVGTISYSLYLWQNPFLNPSSTAWPTELPINVVLAFVAAVCSYYIIERPFLRLKSLLSRSRVASRGAASIGF